MAELDKCWHICEYAYSIEHMANVEQIHELPFPIDVVQQRLSSADYLAAQMPAAVQLDFRGLEGDTLVPGSEIGIAIDLYDLDEQWSAFAPLLTKLRALKRGNNPTTLKVLQPEQNSTRLGTYIQPFGRIGLSYGLEAGLEPDVTITKTVLDAQRFHRFGGALLQQGANYLVPLLFGNSYTLELAPGLPASDADKQIA